MKEVADDDRSLSPPNVPQTDRIEGRCDVCDKKDGFKGHLLRKCTTCRVCVHETCYGLVQTEEGRPNPFWQCHACRAVGKDVQVSKPGEERRLVRQEGRPTDCALCPIVGGIHAMHPLYDTHGTRGTQIVLRADRVRELPKRLAWVHTLCAMATGQSRQASGCVFGCDADGGYEGEEEEEEGEEQGEKDDDDYDAQEPPKKKARKKDNAGGKKGQHNMEHDLHSSEDEDGSDSELDDVHHFVITGKENGEHTKWSRAVADCRTLICYLCGNKGCSPLHIPIQCTANDNDEYEEYKKRHDDPDPCFEGMHVGCAQWGDGKSDHRQVFFWPGQQAGSSGEFSDPVMEIYCYKHAKEVWKNNPRMKKEFAPRSRQTSRQARAASRNNPQEEARRPLLPDRPRYKAAAASRTTAQSESARAEPVQQRKPISNETKGSSASAQRRVERTERRDWFEDIKDDVVSVIKSAQDRNADVREATSRCRKHWKQQAGLPKAEFKKVWAKVQEAINEMPELRVEAADNATENGEVRTANGSEILETPNVWSHLWMPGYTGGRFEFGSWDTCDEYDPSEHVK